MSTEAPVTTTTTTTKPAPLRGLRARLHEVQHALSTLRWRVSLALLAAVVVAVSAGTIAHLVEVSARLEHDLQAQSNRVTAAIRTDLEQTATALDEELHTAADPRQGVARLLSSARVEARFLGAQSRLTSGRLEVLKVLQPDGTILTSGHWPASFGALDPLIAAYTNDPGRLPRIVDEATPQGSAPALERWTTLRASGREVVVVAGRFLDGPALERVRARTGADVLALCRRVDMTGGDSGVRNPTRSVDDGGACLAVRAPTLAAEPSFDPGARNNRSRLHLEAVDVGGHLLWIGLDRSGIDTVRSGIIGRAILVGILAVVFAVVLGAMLATRLVQPIESLAEAAARLAGGDLSVRVSSQKTEGEVQELVLAFNKMAADLEQGQRKLVQTERVAAWQEIARGLAHELKNPLTPILSAMDVIKRARQLQRPDFDAILHEQATAVVEEVMRLKELADAFARFARLPEQKLEALNPCELVDNALALYAGVDKEGSTVVVERDYGAAPATIDADRTQLLTVVTNLVKNAVEAMDEKGTLKATIRSAPKADADDDANDVEVVFDDSGPGIAPEVAGRLFTPYVTTKGSRGTGLGLALSHRIVVEHGGTIEASRSPLGGARFVIRLPQRRSGVTSRLVPPITDQA
ncbi:MAG: ATP-binding protein [Deltaproteobacteria bacterium]|nr:ATP-binding protein [Deltaproteobacteria bacterium]